jgi:hypothetical protein
VLSIRCAAVRRRGERPPINGGGDLKENIMYTITQLADARHAERLREAERARIAAGARASTRSARRARRAVSTPARRIIRAILLRPAM